MISGSVQVDSASMLVRTIPHRLAARATDRWVYRHPSDMPQATRGPPCGRMAQAASLLSRGQCSAEQYPLCKRPGVQP